MNSEKFWNHVAVACLVSNWCQKLHKFENFKILNFEVSFGFRGREIRNRRTFCIMIVPPKSNFHWDLIFQDFGVLMKSASHPSLCRAESATSTEQSTKTYRKCRISKPQIDDQDDPPRLQSYFDGKKPSLQVIWRHESKASAENNCGKTIVKPTEFTDFET